MLSHAIILTKLDAPGVGDPPGLAVRGSCSWSRRSFFLPALSMGTVSPVVAKLAVDRLRQIKRTGTAIGQVYAWGMVGSILGTFLDRVRPHRRSGNQGRAAPAGHLLAFSATALGSVWHAAWAGIPLGLCVIAFVPVRLTSRQGTSWGIREEKGDPTTKEDADRLGRREQLLLHQGHQRTGRRGT